MLINFKNKVVLITGTSKGIGKELHKNFLKLGAKVHGFNSKDYDLTEAKGIRNLCNYIENLKKIDVLINNASINFKKQLIDINNEEYSKLLSINLDAYTFLSKSAVKKMITTKTKGRIINISSIVSQRVFSGRTPYSISKHAVLGLTKSLSQEYSKYGILTNSVSPGFTLTPLTKSMLTKKDIKKLSSRVPIGRMATTNDISNIVIYLCSKFNTYVTGQNIICDGGFSVSMN